MIRASQLAESAPAPDLGEPEEEIDEVVPPARGEAPNVSSTIHHGMADSQHGWWFPEEGQDHDQPFGYLRANVNALIRDEPARCSEGTGGWLQTGLPCRIVPDG
jgi:hypothetical protein